MGVFHCYVCLSGGQVVFHYSHKYHGHHMHGPMGISMFPMTEEKNNDGIHLLFTAWRWGNSVIESLWMGFGMLNRLTVG